MNLDKIYYDEDGRKRNILQMVKENPEWAANRVQEGEHAIDVVARIQRSVYWLRLEQVDGIKFGDEK